MREMRSTVLYRPFANTDSHYVRYVAMNSTTIVHIIEQLIQYLLRDILLHFLAREHIGCEIVLHFAFGHCQIH